MAALTAEDPAGASCEQGTVPFTTIYSGNYAGYRVHDSTVGATEFDSTDSTWTVPDVEDHIHTGCSAGDSTPSVAAWVGIGATDIIQSGTVSCSTDPASYRFWNEDYSAPPVYEGPSVSAYDEVYASDEWLGSNECEFFEENITTGHYDSYLDSSCTHHGENYADYITELSKDMYLPNFGSYFHDYNDFADSNSNNYTLTSSNAQKLIMTSDCTSGGTVLATPGAISSSDAGFETTHEADSPICN